MKLYECPRKSLVRVLDPDPRTPVSSRAVNQGHVLKFDHIDGMYSLCYDNKGNVVHLVAWAEVELLDNQMES
jgi:hypothetical protein